jgi:hypothetical protein
MHADDMNGMGQIVRNIGGCFKQKEVTPGVPNMCLLHNIMVSECVCVTQAVLAHAFGQAGSA